MNAMLIYNRFAVFTLLWLLLSLVACSTQDDVTPQTKASLLSRSWQISSATAEYGRVTYVYYEKGGTDNDEDLSGYQFTFRANNTYSLTDGTQTYSGNWALTQQDTVIQLDGQDSFTVTELTETALVFYYLTEETDSDGNTVSVKTTFQLIPV